MRQHIWSITGDKEILKQGGAGSFLLKICSEYHAIYTYINIYVHIYHCWHLPQKELEISDPVLWHSGLGAEMVMPRLI